MKSLICTFILAITFDAAFAANKQERSASEPITIGQSDTLQASDGDVYELNVYLPRSYQKEPSKKYPVLYLIDGGREQDFNHIAGLADLASINPYTFQELLVVGIKTNNRLLELTSINKDPRYDREEGTLGGSDKFRDFLKSKVIPFTDKTWRTNSKRIVMGESLAGLFITETFLQTPELFTDYVSISPSLWYDDRNLAKNAIKLLSTHTDQARSLYIAMANEGGTMQKGLDEVLEAVKGSTLKNLKVKYQDKRQSEFHWSIYHGEALSALSWLLPVPKPEFADEPDPWYLIEGANPPNWGKISAIEKNVEK